MSQKITPDQVRHVARLSRLRLSEADVERFSHELSAILDYVAQLDELDTTGVEPTAHAVHLRNVLRNDEPQPSLDPREALGDAPERSRGLFSVPGALDRSGR